MINELTILLFLLCIALLIIAAIYHNTADQYLARAPQARADAEQHAALAAAQEYRAYLYHRSMEQMTDRIGLLVAHNKELEAENEELHRRVLYLTNLVNHLDTLAIVRLAEMDRPLMWLPNERRSSEPNTINLN